MLSACSPGTRLKLSVFINEHIEAILAEWDLFAKTLGVIGGELTDEALRDHAREILKAIAEDIERPQSSAEQSKKSKGEAQDEPKSAASEHGKLRQEDGFTMVQMVAEYRALRASVLRLWLLEVKQVTEATTNDMLRFNEAVDQAVAESAARFTEQTTRARDTFLAILGHDLRTPLAAMSMAGDILVAPTVATATVNEVGRKVKRSASSMNAVVNDLLEFARSQLGNAMPVNRAPVNMAEIVQAAIDDAALAYPRCSFSQNASGDLSGSFDKARLQQALANLLANAAQYGSHNHPVELSASEELDGLVFKVNNKGPVIPQESLGDIFDPLVQLPIHTQRGGRAPTSMGLGLFIARQVAEGHNGVITVESSASSGTTFTIRIPKK
jgi:signal transduction histidine kinase